MRVFLLSLVLLWFSPVGWAHLAPQLPANQVRSVKLLRRSNGGVIPWGDYVGRLMRPRWDDHDLSFRAQPVERTAYGYVFNKVQEVCDICPSHTRPFRMSIARLNL